MRSIVSLCRGMSGRRTNGLVVLYLHSKGLGGGVDRDVEILERDLRRSSRQYEAGSEMGEDSRR
jgi:hypothetical protein